MKTSTTKKLPFTDERVNKRTIRAKFNDDQLRALVANEVMLQAGVTSHEAQFAAMTGSYSADGQYSVCIEIDLSAVYGAQEARDQA